MSRFILFLDVSASLRMKHVNVCSALGCSYRPMEDGEVAQKAKGLATKPEDEFDSRTYMVRGENRLPQVVL